MHWTLVHGRSEPPEPTRTLRAGGTEAVLDGIDLRYVRSGPAEAIRRVYVAVRDHNWNTVPAQVSDVSVEQQADAFTVRFLARHDQGALSFAWRGEIHGAGDGVITYTMDGVAESDFDYNRIGFCVLHPIDESRDARYRAQTADGPVEGRFPDLIAPQRFEDGRYVALFEPVDRLAIDLPGEGRVVLSFTGDRFETEDQRNWTDASHKTYCTPLALGYPHRATTGRPIRQSVRIEVDRGTSAQRTAAEEVPAAVRIGEPSGALLGALGLGSRSRDEPLGGRAIELLRAVAPDHLRADVRLADPEHRDVLERAKRDCDALGCPLELALHLLEDDAEALAAVVGALRAAPLARVLVYAADAASPGPRETTPAALVQLVRGALGRGDVSVGGGTDMYFCELNRTRPQSEAFDVVAWSVNPQVHAFDARSMVETLAAQAETVRSARSFAADRALAVSPVTLRPRFNANATRPEGDRRSAAELPANVDVRQASLLAAAWTVGSIAALMGAGLDSATYFEPTGWRGLIEAETARDGADSQFPSTPGMTFPLYHVLADLAGLHGAPLLSADVSDPLRVACVAVLCPGGGTRVLVANLTPAPLAVQLHGIAVAAAQIRMLDADTGPEATEDPGAFRRRTQPLAGPLLNLAAYAVARIDIEGDPSS
jgi:hypothetical protein